MRLHRHVLCAVLAGVLLLPLSGAAHTNAVLERLVSLGEQPLVRVADLGGIVGAESVDFTDGSEYLKQMVPPALLPLKKPVPHLVLVVNLSSDIMHPDYRICMFNPRDISTRRNDTLMVPTVRIDWKDPKRHERGIWITLTMSQQEHDRSPAILPAFAR